MTNCAHAVLQGAATAGMHVHVATGDRRQAAAIGQLEQLAQLFDFLAGRITHFVVVNHGYNEGYTRSISIETFKDAMTVDDNWPRGQLKLLSLCGDSKGDLAWRINRSG